MNPLAFKSIYLGLAFSSIVPTLLAPVAVTTVQAQVTETIIYVHPRTGDDQTGTGSENRPYQTITKALAVAPTNSIIQLAEGTYSENNGEEFPIVVKKPLEIRGTPRNQGYHVKIEGGGEFYSPTGAGQNVGIVLLAEAALTGVSVTNLRDRGVGVWVESASPTVSRNTLTRNDNTGVAVNGTGQAIVTDNYFYNNSGNGMVIYGQTQPLVKNNTFERTGFGISITEQATPQLISNEIKHNRIGVIVEGKAQPLLQDNVITLSTEDGLVAIGNSRPNLGTANAPGGNVFRSNQGQDIKNLTKNYIIPANGNQIGGEITGKIDQRGTATAPTPPESNLPPLATISRQERPSTQPSRNTSTQEQVWTAPNSPYSQPSVPIGNSPQLNTDTSLSPLHSLPLIPPESGNNSPVSGDIELKLSPANPIATSNRPSRGNPSVNSNSRGNRLEDILVLEPNVSPSNPPSRSNPDLLPVPSGNIPTGNSFPPGTSPEERGRSVGGEYRVVVEITSASDSRKVKDIVPEAFTSRYQGRRVMQVGIFRSQANAEEIRQRLRQQGLQVQVIPL